MAKEQYKKKIIMIVQQEAAQLASQGIELTEQEMKKLFGNLQRGISRCARYPVKHGAKILYSLSGTKCSKAFSSLFLSKFIWQYFGEFIQTLSENGDCKPAG